MGGHACADRGLALLALPPAARAQSDVSKTVHNLTPEGPGKQKETVKTGLCVFCHTPHNGSPGKAHWNKDLPGISYQLYTSTTTRADLKQPTGSSRLCLSCHDGFVAMGNLLVPPPGDALKLGALTGPTVLGTDLSDDHPISFVYDAALAAKHPGLVDPGNLPKTLPLDSTKSLQCTTCHNPHESNRGKFLRMDNPAGRCASCVTTRSAGSSPRTRSRRRRGRAAASIRSPSAARRPWPATAATTATRRIRRRTRSGCSCARRSPTTATSATTAR